MLQQLLLCTFKPSFPESFVSSFQHELLEPSFGPCFELQLPAAASHVSKQWRCFSTTKLAAYRQHCSITACQATILDKQLEPLPEQLDGQLFQNFIPKLEKESLKFWMVLHEEALVAFQQSNFDILPNQRAPSRNANLGNWQASSSAAKQLSFYAWVTHRHPKLASQPAYLMSFELQPASFSQAVAASGAWSFHFSLDYRGQDCQLVVVGQA